ncbi:MAG: hypothetical protein II606_09220, partial [Erysipelotrichaceae bacterium]|nr:hypothetical protein [Erysipelotrichaceae bacterium]
VGVGDGESSGAGTLVDGAAVAARDAAVAIAVVGVGDGESSGTYVGTSRNDHWEILKELSD